MKQITRLFKSDRFRAICIVLWFTGFLTFAISGYTEWAISEMLSWVGIIAFGVFSTLDKVCAFVTYSGERTKNTAN